MYLHELVALHGYAGLALAGAVEGFVPPVASEVILPFFGYLASRNAALVGHALGASTLGSCAGAAVLFGVGRRLSRVRLGTCVGTTLQAWFARRGTSAVFLRHTIPLVRSLVPLGAGAAGMPVSRFAIAVTAGTTAWNAMLLGAGYALGGSWHAVAADIADVQWGILSAILLIGALWLAQARGAGRGRGGGRGRGSGRG